jgi:hypothetical protein
VWLRFTEVPIPSNRRRLNLFVFNREYVVRRLQSSVTMNLRIFAITRQGLIALSLAVAALWTCVGMEAATRHRSDRDAAASIRTLAELRHITQRPDLATPTRNPVPRFHSARSWTS